MSWHTCCWRESAPDTGGQGHRWWNSIAGSWLLRAQHPFLNSPKELRSPVSFPSLAVGETSQHCGLDMASSLWAGNSAQSRHRIGKHFLFTSGSLWGDSQGLQPARKPAGAGNRVRDGEEAAGPFSGAGLGPAGRLKGLHWALSCQDTFLSVGTQKPAGRPCPWARKAGFSAGHAHGSYHSRCYHPPQLLGTAAGVVQRTLTMCMVLPTVVQTSSPAAPSNQCLACPWGLDPLTVPFAIPAVPIDSALLHGTALAWGAELCGRQLPGGPWSSREGSQEGSGLLVRILGSCEFMNRPQWGCPGSSRAQELDRYDPVVT